MGANPSRLDTPPISAITSGIHLPVDSEFTFRDSALSSNSESPALEWLHQRIGKHETSRRKRSWRTEYLTKFSSTYRSSITGDFQFRWTSSNLRESNLVYSRIQAGPMTSNTYDNLIHALILQSHVAPAFSFEIWFFNPLVKSDQWD